MMVLTIMTAILTRLNNKTKKPCQTYQNRYNFPCLSLNKTTFGKSSRATDTCLSLTVNKQLP